MNAILKKGRNWISNEKDMKIVSGKIYFNFLRHLFSWEENVDFDIHKA